MFAISCCTLLAVFLGSATADQYNNSVPVNAPANVPGGASAVVDHHFHSWACAVHWWPDYAGNNSNRNIFSQTLVKIISDKLGVDPYIRVGGTSGDRTTWVPDQQISIITQTGKNGIPSAVSIGPVYFEGFNNFPGARYHFHLNMGFNGSNAIPNAVGEAQAAVKYIGDNLESLEIGNEVDLYPVQGIRPPDWNVDDFVAEWLNFSQAVTQQVLEPQYSNIGYMAPVYSKPLQSGFTIPAAFGDNIDKNNNIVSASIHQYMTGRTPATRLQESFMNHGAIVGNLSQLIDPMNYLRQNHPDIPLYMDEVNSDPINLNMNQYEGVFGSALWLTDYLLYAMSISIPRIYIQQGTIFGFASWQPVAYPGFGGPKVRPPYYGNLFIADAIGNADDLQVYNIDLNDDHLSAYALYYSGTLTKYAVVNLLEWNTTEYGNRPFQTVELSVPSDCQNAEVTVLAAAGANADSGITWGGLSYNYSSSATDQVEVTGTADIKTLNPSGGKITLDINATEAVLVTLKS